MRLKPKYGARRVKTWFAWFPVTVDTGETRWLEHVMVIQEYKNYAQGVGSRDGWINKTFV